MKSQVRPCPVCGSTDAEELHRLRLVLFDEHPLADECVTASCLDCGMAFARATPPPEAYERYYATLSKYVASTSATAPHPRLPECAQLLARLLPRDASILDAGCGSGGVLAALKQAGFTRLSGLDPTSECVQLVRDELGLDARVGTLATPPFQPATFDVVVSTVVFEHLHAPGMDVDRIGALLKPDGLAYVLVPDASCYAQFMTSPYQDVNIEHINHFSAGTLDKLFAARGWARLSAGSGAFRFSPTWHSTLLWGLYRKGQEPRRPKGSEPALRGGLLDYFSRSAAMLETIERRLSEDLSDVPEVLLWGAGHAASVLLARGAFGATKVRAVVDSNPNYRGRRLGGAPVGGPELRGDFMGPVVVATVRERDAVVDRIKVLGWPNRLVFVRADG